MKSNTIDIIHQIVDSIDINDDRKLLYNGSAFSTYNATPGNIVSNEMLVHDLLNLIYSEFYVTGGCPKKEAVLSSSISHNGSGDEQLKNGFIRELRDANSSKERWDQKWIVDSVDPTGAVHVKKGNSSRYTFPGEFIKEFLQHRAVKKDDLVRLIVRNEFDDANEAFYFVFGDSITEESYQYLVRFYLNIRPEASAELISLLTKEFNRYFIPFQFKCLNDPGTYARCDAAVLYIDKRYFKIALDILSIIHVLLKRHIKPQVPLFTKKLAAGFAFAENPLNPEDSFGISRSKMIATAIVETFNSKTSKNKWAGEVLSRIERNGYSIDDFHLNPGSKYYYDFSCFNT